MISLPWKLPESRWSVPMAPAVLLSILRECEPITVQFFAFVTPNAIGKITDRGNTEWQRVDDHRLRLRIARACRRRDRARRLAQAANVDLLPRVPARVAPHGRHRVLAVCLQTRTKREWRDRGWEWPEIERRRPTMQRMLEFMARWATDYVSEQEEDE